VSDQDKTAAKKRRERMTDDEEYNYLDTHCWFQYFSPTQKPCGKKATWKGNSKHDLTFDRAWRACTEHRQETDVRINDE